MGVEYDTHLICPIPLASAIIKNNGKIISNVFLFIVEVLNDQGD